jgi:hypothetical protein
MPHTLDLREPIVLLIVAAPHFLDDTNHPAAALHDLVTAQPAGSHVTISHGTYDLLPADVVARLQTSPTTTPDTAAYPPPPRDEITAITHGLHLTELDIVPRRRLARRTTPRPRAHTRPSCQRRPARPNT